VVDPQLHDRRFADAQSIGASNIADPWPIRTLWKPKEYLDYIGQVWTDMRPLSLRRKMEGHTTN